jgi:hypothetical protein
MSKKYKGKVCAYCDELGQSADHVFAREFFPVAFRDKLPKVSACLSCNARKADLEHYALTVLPFGGVHTLSSDILRNEAPRRLAKNPKLRAVLKAGQRSVLVNQKGLIVPAMSLPFDGERLSTLFAIIARGLTQHHFDQHVPENYVARASFLTAQGERLFETMMQQHAAAEARGNLAEGLVLYQGVRRGDDVSSTIWRFRLYGGIETSDDVVAPNERPSNIWAFTGRADNS